MLRSLFSRPTCGLALVGGVCSADADADADADAGAFVVGGVEVAPLSMACCGASFNTTARPTIGETVAGISAAAELPAPEEDGASRPVTIAGATGVVVVVVVVVVVGAMGELILVGPKTELELALAGSSSGPSSLVSPQLAPSGIVGGNSNNRLLLLVEERGF